MLSKPSEWEFREALDYKKIAETLNGPYMEPMKRYNGPKIIIANPEHFTRLMLFALEHSTNTRSVERSGAEDRFEKNPMEILTENLRFFASGGDLWNFKTSFLERRLDVRLMSRSVQDYLQHRALLDRAPSEYSALFETVSINVTEFFVTKTPSML